MDSAPRTRYTYDDAYERRVAHPATKVTVISLAHALIVDDSVAIRHFVRAALEPAGYHLIEANDGAEGLNALRAAADPLVVLLDYQMPIMDGLELLQAVAAAGAPLTLHEYILISAYSATFPDAMIELVRQLSVRVLPKPFDPPTLLTAVEQAAQRLTVAPDERIPHLED